MRTPFRLRFRSFRARLLTFVVGLLVLVQGAVLLAVNAANVREARRHIEDALALTAGAFRRSLEAREGILLEKARLLSSDFAFKEVAATGDHATLLSALENHRARVAADVMMLLGMDGLVLADTLHPEAHGGPSPLLPLVERAKESEFGEASAIQPVDGQPYQLVVVPLFTPEPDAWIVIGFGIGDAFAQELQRETRTQVSLLWRHARHAQDARDGRDGGGAWRVFCSTLPSAERRALEAEMSARERYEGRMLEIALAGEEFISWLAPVQDARADVYAVLQRSLSEALEPYLRLRTLLLGVFALGLLLSLGGGVLLAARVTRPVESLARGARRIEAGNYRDPVDVEQDDELGALAGSFNHMMRGLAERDRVRDLLGKVVSPEIAAELLGRDLELGGEERTVSVLFTDIRDFTTLAERETPRRLVQILNVYLTKVAEIVERHGGVVERYIGDAVMTLFGAPISHPDDARRAVRVAMELCDALPEINERVKALGGEPLAVGAGVHTGPVIAGNMGSPDRLNYTCTGDAVNLASRLEGLTKQYKVGAIVSEATVAGCDDLLFRELDRVRVKGRQEPVAIYEPLGLRDAVSPAVAERAARHAEALERLRARDWDAAEALFRDLARDERDAPLYGVYLERIARLRAEPPGPDWDGTVDYAEK